MFLEKDFHDTNEFITLVSHDGYSLRINAFFIWLKRSRYSLWYIARRLGTTPDDIINRLRNRAKFNKAELRKLVYIMGAESAFFVIYFPTFRFRRYVYRCVFGKRMKYKKRRRWKKFEQHQKKRRQKSRDTSDDDGRRTTKNVLSIRCK